MSVIRFCCREDIMARPTGDVTEAELAVLQALWDLGPATIRQITDVVYERGGTSPYATVQKLLERLEAKGCVTRDRSESVHRFAAAVDRDDLIGRRLRAVAETLCEGSLTPLLTHLMRTQPLSDDDRRALRALVDELDAEGRDER
jgi:predicted transcriptional regulator